MKLHKGKALSNKLDSPMVCEVCGKITNVTDAGECDGFSYISNGHKMNTHRFCVDCGMIEEDLGFEEGCKKNDQRY